MGFSFGVSIIKLYQNELTKFCFILGRCFTCAHLILWFIGEKSIPFHRILIYFLILNLEALIKLLAFCIIRNILYPEAMSIASSELVHVQLWTLKPEDFEVSKINLKDTTAARGDAGIIFAVWTYRTISLAGFAKKWICNIRVTISTLIIARSNLYCHGMNQGNNKLRLLLI